MRLFVLVLVATLVATVTLAIQHTFSKTNQKPTPQSSCSNSIPTDKGMLMRSFDDLKFTPLPDNPLMAFAPITGDQNEGAYTQVRIVRAGTDMPVHTHNVEITDVVIKGLWYAGPDMASAKNFGPGSVIVIPAKLPHVSGCRAGTDCVFYHEGKGKFDFTPVKSKLLDKKSGEQL
jgi:quercetin dioxygenase-like cupin family protein